MRKSDYQPLGKYIEQVDLRNRDLRELPLLGVSVEKKLIQSVANTNGTDMSSYKILKKSEFVYIADTSRRGDKIAFALNNTDNDVICSSAYTTFRIKDTTQLLPEYLMMWAKRPEFDRYARYMSHGSVRELFSWEDMCNVMLPVPPIEEQRRIVSEYQTVERRIANNEALIQKLEETAQAIYHHTFVEGIDEENLPEGWNVTDVEHFCIETKSGGTPSRTNDSYWNKKDIPWLKSGEVQNCFVFDTEEYISKEGMECSSAKLIPKDSVVMAMYGATASQVCYLKNEMTTNQACCNMICDSKSKACFLYFHLKAIQSDIKKLANGGAQENLNKELVVSQRIICAPNDCYLPFLKIGNYISNISEENIHLRTLLSLLTSKLS